MGNIYKDARAKLSAAQRDQMDIEYQAMKAKGKLAFTSKVTGLDYTIPGNSKVKKTVYKPSSASKDFMNKVMGVTQPKSVDIRTDKGVTAPAIPEAPKIGVPEKYTPSVSKSSTSVAFKPQEQILSELDKTVKAYDSGKSLSELSAINRARSDKNQSSLSPKKVVPVKKPSEKSSYLGTAPKFLGSTAGARYLSQFANRGADYTLGAVDKALVTNMNRKELISQEMTEKDLNPSMKSLMYKMADAQVKKTGKNTGSISYKKLREVCSC